MTVLMVSEVLDSELIDWFNSLTPERREFIMFHARELRTGDGL